MKQNDERWEGEGGMEEGSAREIEDISDGKERLKCETNRQINLRLYYQEQNVDARVD